MKKGKKAAIIIIAVIASAAIVVGGLILGGVIPVGNKRTASAQEIAVDDTAMTAYIAVFLLPNQTFARLSSPIACKKLFSNPI